jgi:hypothetical protein
MAHRVVFPAATHLDCSLLFGLLGLLGLLTTSCLADIGVRSKVRFRKK